MFDKQKLVEFFLHQFCMKIILISNCLEIILISNCLKIILISNCLKIILISNCLKIILISNCLKIILISNCLKIILISNCLKIILISNCLKIILISNCLACQVALEFFFWQLFFGWSARWSFYSGKGILLYAEEDVLHSSVIGNEKSFHITRILMNLCILTHSIYIE